MAKIASIDFLIDTKQLKDSLNKIDDEIDFIKNHPDKQYADNRIKQIELNLDAILYKAIEEHIKIIP